MSLESLNFGHMRRTREDAEKIVALCLPDHVGESHTERMFKAGGKDYMRGLVALAMDAGAQKANLKFVRELVDLEMARPLGTLPLLKFHDLWWVQFAGHVLDETRFCFMTDAAAFLDLNLAEYRSAPWKEKWDTLGTAN